MDNIKKSVTNLIRFNKKPVQSVESHNNDELDPSNPFYENSVVGQQQIRVAKEESRNLPLNNPHRERELLECIDKVYFLDNVVDSSEYELKKLPDAAIDLNQINARRKLMKEQLAVVTKKIFNFILENYPSYSVELKKVTELQQSIQNTFLVCQRSRRQLSRSESVLTTAGLSSMAKYRKRQRLIKTFELLTRIKTLQATDVRLRQLLEEDNTLNAIQLCLDCRKAAEIYKEYTCVSDLSSKLNSTLVEIEDHLDNILLANTLNFDLERYSRVVSAYMILNEAKNVADRIVHHTCTSIEDTSLSVIKVHCDVNQLSVDDQRYNELCQCVPADQFLACFKEMLKLMWQILCSYHCFIWWHSEHAVSSATVDSQLNREIKQTLEKNFENVWNRVCSKISTFVEQSNDLSGLKFAEFLEMVDLTSRFIEIGQKFFSSNSTELEEVVRQYSLNYIKTHHRECLDELRAFLITEEWSALPFEPRFTWRDMPEFAFAQKTSHFLQQPTTIDKHQQQSSSSSVASNIIMGTGTYKLMNPSSTNPFSEYPSVGNLNKESNALNGEDVDSTPVVKEGEAESDVSDDDVIDDAATGKRDSVDEIIVPTNIFSLKRRYSYRPVEKLKPFVCNSSLNLLRLFGRYLNIAYVFPSVAFDVVSMLSQLFDYYIYVIYNVFAIGGDAYTYGVKLLTNKLASTLNRLRCTGSSIRENESNGGSASFSAPAAPPAVIDNNPQSDSMQTLPQRIIAVESLIFVAKQLLDLRISIESLLPPAKKIFAQQFYTHTVTVVEDLRRPIYGYVAVKSIPYDYWRTLIENTNWDINELMSQHNTYVDYILKDLVNFRQRLVDIAENRLSIPKETYDILWEVTIKIVFRILVDGYSLAKKCSNEGRALMQLDFQHFLLELEKIVNIKPIPDKEFVEAFIKAYYLPEKSMEEWIKERKEYTPRQVINLLNIASTHISKKTRLRLIGLLEAEEVGKV